MTSLESTEALDPRSDTLDTWPAATLLHALWEGQLGAVAAIHQALPSLAAATEAATARLRAHLGRLVYTGAGSSARLGAQDGAELAPTFDWPEARLLLLPAGGPGALARAIENAEDGTSEAEAAIRHHAIGPADVLIALAASGATPFTVAAARAARAAGALTIGIANAPASLLDAVDHPVLIPTGAEAIAGSTRMKAGTAQKVALNLLSTGIMVGLHRTHRGRMVDMRATNAKLRARAIRMVADLAGAGEDQAAAALHQSGNRLKPAILIAAGRTPAEADRALAEAGGDLRAALASSSPHP